MTKQVGPLKKRIGYAGYTTAQVGERARKPRKGARNHFIQINEAAAKQIGFTPQTKPNNSLSKTLSEDEAGLLYNTIDVKYKDDRYTNAKGTTAKVERPVATTRHGKSITVITTRKRTTKIGGKSVTKPVEIAIQVPSAFNVKRTREFLKRCKTAKAWRNPSGRVYQVNIAKNKGV
jgi:hypothetical protein